MKRRVKLVCFGMAIMFFSSLALINAQGRPGAPIGASAMPPPDYFAPVPNQLEINKWMDFLEEELSLDAEQKVRIKDIYEDHYRKVASVQPGYTRIYDGMDERISELEWELLVKVESQLSDEQTEKYESILEERELGREGHAQLEEYPPHEDDDCEDLEE